MTPTIRHCDLAAPGLDWQRIPHLGMILLSSDRATEMELQHMLPADVAAVHYSRVAMGASCDVASLRALETGLSRAASELLPDTPLDAIGFSCTSGAIAIGTARVAECINESHPGVPVTAPLTAATAALAEVGVSRVAVLTPYVDEVNTLIHAALTDAGLTIPDFASFHLNTDAEMSAVSPASLRAAALTLNTPATEALFISCTAIHTSGVIATLEAATGKPVITSHQAMLWHALALAGIDTPLPGLGRLLTRPQRSAGVSR